MKKTKEAMLITPVPDFRVFFKINCILCHINSHLTDPLVFIPLAAVIDTDS